MYEYLETMPGYRQYGRFKYTPQALDARLAQIYEINRTSAAAYSPIDVDTEPLFTDRDRVVERIRQLAPFNQMDGSWLRHIVHAGPTDQIRSLLTEIWMDEVGAGDPSQNHANVYTDLLRSVGIYMPPITSEAYATNPDLWDSSYSSPVYQHAISQFTDTYYPEILGMTLYLEWEANALEKQVKLYRYYGFTPLFYQLHVAIDNAADGHAAMALEAVKAYMDHVRAESGTQEMEKHWERVWNGYISFGFVGGGGWEYKFENPPSLEERMVDLVEQKRPYGELSHGSVRLGPNYINDWFEDPVAFLAELSGCDLIVRGHADESRIFDLFAPHGPMLKVFTPADQLLWRDWINSLPAGPDGRALTAPAAMVVVLEQMRARGIGTQAHRGRLLTGPDPTGDPDSGENVTYPVSWWFQLDHTEHLMRALSSPESGWITPGNADRSRFVTGLLASDGDMARTLSLPLQEVGGRTGRQVIIDWINGGCEILDIEDTTAAVSIARLGAPPDAAPSLTPATHQALFVRDLPPQKHRPTHEQRRREEAIGARPHAFSLGPQGQQALRRRFYGPGGGTCH